MQVAQKNSSKSPVNLPRHLSWVSSPKTKDAWVVDRERDETILFIKRKSDGVFDLIEPNGGNVIYTGRISNGLTKAIENCVKQS